LAVSCVLLDKRFYRSSLLDLQRLPPLKELVKRQVDHVLALQPIRLGVVLDQVDIERVDEVGGRKRTV
jgi:hypothetical protein